MDILSVWIFKNIRSTQGSIYSKVFLVIFLVGLFISDNFKVEFVIATFCLSALIGSLFFIKYCDFAKNFLTEGIYSVKKSKYFDKIFSFNIKKPSQIFYQHF